MVISDILGKFPQKSQKLAQAMTDAGLHCVGCGAATWETLEGGMLGHGMDEKTVEGLVNRLNEILLQEVDLKTITLTKRAAAKFIAIAKEEGMENAPFLRFGDKPGGCSGFEYHLDFEEEASEKDQVFESNGVKVLVAKEAIPRLIGCEIDFLDGLNGSGFKISNPNARGSCACGTSQAY